jgi:transcription antitermination factor NusG
MHPSYCSHLPATGGMPLGWYALYTKHQHEKSASQLLVHKGFEVLLPLYRSRSRWSDRTQVVLLPLFPNYLFVKCDLDTRVRVLQTAGVCWFVSSAGFPAAVADADVEMLQCVARAPMNARPHVYLDCGDKVRVIRGPLTGLIGALTRLKNQYRVIISLELLRKSAAIEIDLCDLERISVPAKSAGRQVVQSWKYGELGKRNSEYLPTAQASELSYGK